MATLEGQARSEVGVTRVQFALLQLLMTLFFEALQEALWRYVGIMQWQAMRSGARFFPEADRLIAASTHSAVLMAAFTLVSLALIYQVSRRGRWNPTTVLFTELVVLLTTALLIVVLVVPVFID